MFSSSKKAFRALKIVSAGIVSCLVILASIGAFLKLTGRFRHDQRV